jgi:hypothetical protein
MYYMFLFIDMLLEVTRFIISSLCRKFVSSVEHASVILRFYFSLLQVLLDRKKTGCIFHFLFGLVLVLMNQCEDST